MDEFLEYSDHQLAKEIARQIYHFPKLKEGWIARAVAELDRRFNRS